jgi:hypothetical protein
LVLSPILAAPFFGFVSVGVLGRDPRRDQVQDLSDNWFVSIFGSPEKSQNIFIFWLKQNIGFYRLLKFKLSHECDFVVNKNYFF